MCRVSHNQGPDSTSSFIPLPFHHPPTTSSNSRHTSQEEEEATPTPHHHRARNGPQHARDGPRHARDGYGRRDGHGGGEQWLLRAGRGAGHVLRVHLRQGCAFCAFVSCACVLMWWGGFTMLLRVLRRSPDIHSHTPDHHHNHTHASRRNRAGTGAAPARSTCSRAPSWTAPASTRAPSSAPSCWRWPWR